MEELRPIRFDGSTRLLVLTGAGASAESGLATFRQAGGIWEQDRPEDVATPQAFERDPDRVWAFHVALRHAAGAADPNAAHLALAAAEAHLGDRFALVTQNIDGLHIRAGNHRVHELHGSIWRTRCADCDREPRLDATSPASTPRCTRCGGRMRPDVVWFGERVDPDADWRTKQFVKAAECAGQRLVFLAIGTSGTVAPASSLVRYCRDFGAETWLANLDRADNASDFGHRVLGRATTVVPVLLREVASPA